MANKKYQTFVGDHITKLRFIDNSLLIRIILKLYSNDIYDFKKEAVTATLSFNKNIFIASFNNQLLFFNYEKTLTYINNYQLKYIPNGIIKINDTLIGCFGTRNVHFSSNIHYSFSIDYITLLDISSIDNIKKIWEVGYPQMKVKTITKVHNGLLSIAINNAVTLLDISNHKKIKFLSSYDNLKYEQKEIIAIDEKQILCNDPLVQFDLNNPKNIKLKEKIVYGMEYYSNLFKIDKERIAYTEGRERSNDYLIISQIPSFKCLGKYLIDSYLQPTILFDTNTLVTLNKNLTFLDITNEENINVISEYSLEKYTTSINNEVSMIKMDDNTIFYIVKPVKIIVFKIKKDYLIKEVKEYNLLDLFKNEKD